MTFLWRRDIWFLLPCSPNRNDPQGSASNVWLCWVRRCPLSYSHNMVQPHRSLAADLGWKKGFFRGHINISQVWITPQSNTNRDRHLLHLSSEQPGFQQKAEYLLKVRHHLSFSRWTNKKGKAVGICALCNCKGTERYIPFFFPPEYSIK